MKKGAKKASSKAASAARKSTRARKPRPGSFEALMVAVAIAEKTGFGKYVSE